MKKILTATACLGLSLSVLAQTGMTHDGGAGTGYSRLNRTANAAGKGWERAIGVYQNSIIPFSLLEINSNPAWLPHPQATIPLGEVFSSNAGGADSYWRMRRQNTEYGLLFNNNNTHFGIQASDVNGDLFFNTGGANERVRINAAGQVGINLLSPNNINGGAFETNSQMDMTGPLFFSQSSTVTPRYTVIAGETTVQGNVTNLVRDGYRMEFDHNFTAPNQDYFIFTKTDGNQAPPDGGFAFISRGNDEAEILNMTINGFGRTYIGHSLANAAYANMNSATLGTRLTLETAATDAYFTSTMGSSGLRFTNMTAVISTPIANPGLGVLAVDKNGHVIYVKESAGAGGLGNNCTTGPQVPLTSNWEIPLGNNNFAFTGQGGTNINNVGIGTGCIPTAKLEILENSTVNGSTALKVTNNDNQGIGGDFIANGPYGVRAVALQQGSGLTTTGVYGEAKYNSTKANFGVEGWASLSTSGNYGGRFHAVSSINNANFNYGLEAEGANAITNYGAYIQGFSTSNPSTTQNIGVYTTAFKAGSGTGNSVALFAEVLNLSTAGDWAGIFNGDVNINGTGYYNGFTVITSDQTIKKNIKPVENALGIINKLSPKTYNLDNSNVPQMRFDGQNQKTQFGLIAQEVEKVLPEIVAEVKVPAKYDKEGKLINEAKDLKGVQYEELISILVKGMQEQQQQIDELKKQVAATSSNTTSTSDKSINNATIDLSDKNAIVLNQNVPNPFAEQTTITYTIPNDFSKAQIIFTNNEGKIINTFEIKEKGQGKLNVFASDLSSGSYNYTLVVDGKNIDTKRMVKD
jgi:hypothetical protein